MADKVFLKVELLKDRVFPAYPEKNQDPIMFDRNKPIVVELSIPDDIYNQLELGKDEGILALMVEDARTLIDETVDDWVVALKKTNKDAKSPGTRFPDIVNLSRLFFARVKTDTSVLEDKLKKVPKKRWDEFVRKNKEYEEYKFWGGVAVVGAAGSVTASVLSMGLAVPTAGVSLAFSIVALARSCVELTKAIRDLVQDAQEVGESVYEDLEALSKSVVKSKNEAKSAGSEAAKLALNKTLGVEIVTTVSGTKKNVAKWGNKITGMQVDSRELVKKATEMMKDVKRLDTIMDQDQANRLPEKKDIKEKADLLGKKVDALLSAAGDLNKESLKNEKAQEAADNAVTELSKKVPNYVKVFEKVYGICLDAGMASGGAATGLVTSAVETMDIAMTTLTLADGLRSVMQDAKEAAEK
jgi:hypothetical protein